VLTGDAVKIYPTGEKSNNTVYNASAAGTIPKLPVEDEDGNSKYVVSIQTDAGETVVENSTRT